MSIFADTLSRFLTDTETDADSPDNETTYGDLRRIVEMLAIRVFSTGASGTLTSDPPNDTTGEAEDTAASFTDDEHNGRTLLFTDGNAMGKLFTIDDTQAANDAVYATGDNLYTAGARSGDAYLILYDQLVNDDGHDHDGVNSARANLPDGTVQFLVDHNGGTVHSETSTSYQTKLTHGVYIPSDANTMRLYGRIKNTAGSTPKTYLAFTVNSQQSTAGTTASSSYTWVSTDLDISGITPGQYDCDIELKVDANQGDLQGMFFAFFN